MNTRTLEEKEWVNRQAMKKVQCCLQVWETSKLDKLGNSQLAL